MTKLLERLALLLTLPLLPFVAMYDYFYVSRILHIETSLSGSFGVAWSVWKEQFA